jgi:hypothetical protein
MNDWGKLKGDDLKKRRGGKKKIQRSFFVVPDYLGKSRQDRDGVLTECEKHPELVGKTIKEAQRIAKEKIDGKPA